MAEAEKFSYVVGETQHDLRSTVPPGGHVFGHEALISPRFNVVIIIRLVPSGQTKITDLQLAISVNEEIAWLEISMDDIGRVDVLESAQSLIDKRLKMGIR